MCDINLVISVWTFHVGLAISPVVCHYIFITRTDRQLFTEIVFDPIYYICKILTCITIFELMSILNVKVFIALSILHVINLFIVFLIMFGNRHPQWYIPGMKCSQKSYSVLVSITVTFDCLLNRLFMPRSKKTSKPHVTGLCVGNSSVSGEFHAQMASCAENVSIWWRHHADG